MALSNWSEAIPSGTSAVGTFPSYARALWAGIASAMGIEHYWNGSGGGSDASTGDLRPGGSRTFVAARSASSVPSQGTGRLFYASDESRLLMYGSAATYLVGTASYDEFETASTGGGYMLRQTGTINFTGNLATTSPVNFPIPCLTAPPTVFFSANSDAFCAAFNITTSGFDSVISRINSSNNTVFWEALTYVSSVSF